MRFVCVVLRRLELGVGVVLGVAATLIMFANAMLRYIFNDSLVWAEETIRIIFVAAMFLAITMSFVRDEHVGFGALADHSELGRRIRNVGFSLALIAVGGIAAWYGWTYNGFIGGTPLPGTDLPTGVLLLPGIVACALWVPIGIYHLIRAFAPKTSAASDAGRNA